MNGGHSPAEGETQVEAELTRLKTELVSDADLEKAKNQILRDFILSRQTAQSRAEELGYAAVVLKDPELVNTELQRFLDVTPQDIQRVARKYFVQENKTLVEVYPKKDSGEKASLETAEGSRQMKSERQKAKGKGLVESANGQRCLERETAALRATGRGPREFGTRLCRKSACPRVPQSRSLESQVPSPHSA